MAIYAAIDKVLHLSGAAEPLDLVMDTFDSGSSNSPVPSGKYGGADLDIRLSLLDLFGDCTCQPKSLHADVVEV